jgi:antirestriction protein ArdC
MDRTEQQAALVAKLTAGIAGLADSNRWQEHLDYQARFHRYSFGNAVLIAAQCPGATRVAGYRAWQRLGRTVRRGERAIWILAPMVVAKGDPGRTPDDRPDKVVRGFKYVPVFDVSQTEGEPVPVICTPLAGDAPGSCFDRLADAARSLGYRVEDADLAAGTHGDCHFGLRRIRVAQGNSPAQRVKTLAHEIAHALLHDGERNRPLAELEAESTAYVVCQQLGLDTGDYSFGYVTAWAGGSEQAIEAIRSSCANIQRAAAFLIESTATEREAVPQPA